MTTLRAFGPSGAFTASAMMLTPRSSAARASSANLSCFGIARVPPYSRMARTSSSRMIRYSLSSSLTSEPAARRRAVRLFRTHDVSPLGRARGGAGAARSAPPCRLRRPGAVGPPPQRAVELGHHQAARPGEVDLLLPVRHARRVQPLRGRLDGVAG